MPFVRLLPFALGLALTVACGGTDTETDDSSELSESGTDEAGLRTGITFTKFSDSVGTHAATESRKLFTTSSAYKTFFGHTPPSSVDFTREWVAFYSAGTMATDGYDAYVDKIETSSTGATIYMTTRLESPASNCSVNQTTTKPYELVKFKKPSTKPRYTRYSTNDETISCQAASCDDIICPLNAHCVNGSSAGPHCVADPCPGAGKRSPSSFLCQCTVVGLCPIGTSWNDDPSVCGCE